MNAEIEHSNARSARCRVCGDRVTYWYEGTSAVDVFEVLDWFKRAHEHLTEAQQEIVHAVEANNARIVAARHEDKRR